jgi:hypothetical protein
MACWDSVPGMETALDIVPENPSAPMPTAISTAAQMPVTSHRRRNEARPSRYRNVATLELPMCFAPDCVQGRS